MNPGGGKKHRVASRDEVQIPEWLHSYARPIFLAMVFAVATGAFQIYQQSNTNAQQQVTIAEHQANSYKWDTDQEKKILGNTDQIVALAIERALSCEDVLLYVTGKDDRIRELEAVIEELQR